MTFPATPLDLTVELNLDGTWTDVTSLVYGRDDLTVNRGRSDEGSVVDRSSCSLTANNRSGNLSPRNPTGAHYGLIGRNTPLRVRVDPATPKYLLFTGAWNSNALATSPDTECSTPDAAALDITGDIDIRIDFEPEDWTLYNGAGLVNKYGLGDQRSWNLWLLDDLTIEFAWSTDGTFPNTLFKRSTASVTPPANGRIAVRVTLDVNNGAGGNTVTFYTSDTLAGTWTQLGSTVVTGGVTSIFSSTADVELGRSHSTTNGGDLRGRIYGFQLRQNIAGTVRAHVVVDDDAEAGDQSFTGTDTLAWTLNGDAYVVDPSVRFHGEVSDWPQKWDISGRDRYVPLEASGILRRLSQGASPLRSTMYQGITSIDPAPLAYWPCEDGQDSTVIASGLTGGQAMTFKTAPGGTTRPEFATHTGFKCSAPLPTFNETQWTGVVPTYTATGTQQVRFLMQVPAAGALDAEGICLLRQSGTAPEWRLLYETGGGDLTIQAYDADGAQLFTNTTDFNVDGRLLQVAIELDQNGANIDWTVAILEVGDSSGTTNSGTLNSRTFGRCLAVVMNAGADHTDIAAGHVAVWDEITSIFDLAEQLNAYTGETAGNRIQRLCDEAGITFRSYGDRNTSTPLGYQLPATVLDLIREAEEADGGILFEPRDIFGLAYRPREDLFVQPAALELDHGAFDLSNIEPIDDDQRTRNDVTATRVDGSSARSVQETGVLSILAPPDGVGRYDEEVTLSLEGDYLVADQAGWRRFLGTIDEARYPGLLLNLARTNFTVSSGALALAAMELDIGDRLVIENPPAGLPPEDITQLAQGFVETLSNFTHTIEVNGSPSRPYDLAGVYDSEAARYSSDGTTTTEALDTTETSIDISTPSGPVWGDDDTPFDIAIGGERITVGAVVGTGASQVFGSCTRSVNGVVKTHATGATVELATPAVYVP